MSSSRSWSAKIDPNSPIPLYSQLKQEITRQLASSQIEVGSKIPSEKEFAALAGLSRFTIRQALEELQREGWLEKRQGRGTFVARPSVPLSVAWKLVGFMEDMTRKGYRVGSQVKDIKLVAPPMAVAKALGVPPAGRVVHIQRVRSLDGHPFLVDSVFVRSDLCPGLDAMDLNDKSLFQVIESRYHKIIVRSRRILAISTAEAWVAKMLGIPRGSPLFRLTDLSFTTDGAPILNSEILITNERAEFVFDLVRSPGDRKKRSLSFSHSAYPTPNRTADKGRTPLRERRRRGSR